MRLSEFEIQDKYCRENNTPGGKGCDNCPARDKEHCADALRNLCGKLIKNLPRDDGSGDKTEFARSSKQLEKEYGISFWAQLGLFQGYIELPA